jgi:hypothetical protein
MQNHLVVYRRVKDKDYIDWMLKGQKTLDIKFSYRRVAPYGYVTPGDYMYIKEASGPVVGRCLLSEVSYVDVSNPLQILDTLVSTYQDLGLRDEAHAERVFQKMQDKRYMTIFRLAEPEELSRPIYIEKNDRRVWVPNYQLPFELKLAYGIDPMFQQEGTVVDEQLFENELENPEDQVDSESDDGSELGRLR